MFHHLFIPCSQALNLAGFVFSTFANTMLMHVIKTASTPNFGNYTKLMYTNSINLVVFSGLHMLLTPIISIEKNILYVFSPDLLFSLPKIVVRGLMACYGASYCFSLVICAITFVFRYDRVCNGGVLTMFRTKTQLLFWLLLNLLISLTWAVFIYFVALPTPYTDQKITKPLMETYGTSLQNVTYVAAVYQMINPKTGIEEWNQGGVVMGVVFSTIILGSIATIFGCSWKVIKRVKAADEHLLQSELFRAQCIQACIPILLIFAPIFFLIVLPIFCINGNIVFSFVNVLLAVFPIMDPFAIIFTVTQYRQALTRKSINRYEEHP